MKRLRTCQCPPEDEASEVAKIFGLLKVYTPCEILLDGLSGKELFAGRGNLEEKCSGAIKNSSRGCCQNIRETNKVVCRQPCSGPRRATPWSNVATPSIPTHFFIWCNMYLNLLITDKAREEATFLPPLLMPTLANQAPNSRPWKPGTHNGPLLPVLIFGKPQTTLGTSVLKVAPSSKTPSTNPPSPSLESDTSTFPSDQARATFPKNSS